MIAGPITPIILISKTLPPPKKRNTVLGPLQKRAAIKWELGSTPQSKYFRKLDKIDENKTSKWVRKASLPQSKKNSSLHSKSVKQILTTKEKKLFQRFSKSYPHFSMKRVTIIANELKLSSTEIIKEATRKDRLKLHEKSPKKIKAKQPLQTSNELPTPLLITLLVMGLLLYIRISTCLTEPQYSNISSYFYNTPQTFAQCLLQS